jgi:hypothetical protein
VKKPSRLAEMIVHFAEAQGRFAVASFAPVKDYVAEYVWVGISPNTSILIEITKPRWLTTPGETPFLKLAESRGFTAFECDNFNAAKIIIERFIASAP